MQALQLIDQARAHTKGLEKHFSRDTVAELQLAHIARWIILQDEAINADTILATATEAINWLICAHHLGVDHA